MYVHIKPAYKYVEEPYSYLPKTGSNQHISQKINIYQMDNKLTLMSHKRNLLAVNT